MYYLIKLFFPINFLIIQLKGFISRVFIKDKHLPSITEEDIKTLINISEEEGVIDKEEKELIHRSMDFDDILVGEALTPRIDMVAIEVNQSIEEIKQVFFNQRYSRIPVYEDTIDNIIGILSEKEFLIRLLKYETVNIRELLREPIFVVESVKISSLLPKLQKSKLHMAIVLDEFGGTAGLITLEDILEEIVGEIWDEQDETRNSMIKINETTYKFDAQCQLNEFAELMEVNLPESSYHTLGGWVIERFQEIPAIGSMFAYENLKITVEKVEQRRIRSIIVEKMPPQLFIEQNNMTIMQEVH